jgi:hypothetical protein
LYGCHAPIADTRVVMCTCCASLSPRPVFDVCGNDHPLWNIVTNNLARALSLRLSQRCAHRLLNVQCKQLYACKAVESARATHTQREREREREPRAHVLALVPREPLQESGKTGARLQDREIFMAAMQTSATHKCRYFSAQIRRQAWIEAPGGADKNRRTSLGAKMLMDYTCCIG